MNVFFKKLDKQWNCSILEQELRNDLEFFVYLLLEIQYRQLINTNEKKSAEKNCE